MLCMEIRKRESLKNYTSWQIGGVAEYFCLPTSIAEVKTAVQFSLDHGLVVNLLGGGSNVLISDDGVPGLTICFKRFAKSLATVVENVNGSDLIIECDAGVPKSELLKIYLKHKLAPALFLAGIPGDVAGGVVMNAGVSEQIEPREFCEIVDSITVLKWKEKNLWTEEFAAKDIEWSYRHSHGWQDGMIVRVRLKCANNPMEDIVEKVRLANKNRLLKQPLDKPSCGSVFVNPIGQKAAQLIDSAGLKGLQIGDAQVSIKHANFIVNLGSSTASDVWELILEVQKRVLEYHGVQLKTEVVRLGKW
jgi:UDP-N-acetylmuramate dehydrogenase